MMIGTMNHPARPVLREIQWMADMGFEFVDLTLEPPAAAVWKIDLPETQKILRDHNLPGVGHTAYYLPLCSPFESIRKAAVEELKYCIQAFAQLGAEWMNIHPDRNVPMHDRKYIIERNIQSLRELLPVAEQHGLGLMIENLPGEFNTLAQLAQLLDPLPALGLHLDMPLAEVLGIITDQTSSRWSAYYPLYSSSKSLKNFKKVLRGELAPAEGGWAALQPR